MLFTYRFRTQCIIMTQTRWLPTPCHTCHLQNLDKINSFQARNQKFFRTGEVSWDSGTFFINIINIFINRKKDPAGKHLGVFSPGYSKTTFWLGNLSQRQTQSGHFLQNQGTFSEFQNRAGVTSPPLPPHPTCTPGFLKPVLNVSILRNLIVV